MKTAPSGLSTTIDSPSCCHCGLLWIFDIAYHRRATGQTPNESGVGLLPPRKGSGCNFGAAPFTREQQNVEHARATFTAPRCGLHGIEHLILVACLLAAAGTGETKRAARVDFNHALLAIRHHTTGKSAGTSQVPFNYLIRMNLMSSCPTMSIAGFFQDVATKVSPTPRTASATQLNRRAGMSES